MNYEQKQREAFYLLKKYKSLTWNEEIYRLYKQFCEDYERDFYRFPVTAQPPSRLAGTVYTPGPWDEQNLQMFWGYAEDMEEGLTALKAGDKTRGYQFLTSGGCFGNWLYSRRFEEMDLSDFGYRRSKDLGANQGIFTAAEKAREMKSARSLNIHTDMLRRDFRALSYASFISQDEPVAKTLQIPFGVPPGELPPVPPIDPNAPTVMSGEEVPVNGIWVVEPDEAHRGQTYCMAYLPTWVSAMKTVSEQEYEINSRFERTSEERYRHSPQTAPCPVRWRLLWRDDRDYSNGNTPAEELDYLVYREPVIENDSAFLGLRAVGGETCPHAGYWFTPAQANSRRFFALNERLPDITHSSYGITIWQWSETQVPDKS